MPEDDDGRISAILESTCVNSTNDPDTAVSVMLLKYIHRGDNVSIEQRKPANMNSSVGI